MRKLVSLFLALALVLALVPAAMADDAYTLDIYWVGNGDNEAVRKPNQWRRPYKSGDECKRLVP